MQLFIRDLVTMQKKTDEKMKKAFRSEPLELCKTKAKKSSLDMLNFYVISSGHDMVNDTNSSITCRSKFKAPPIKTKLQNVKFLPGTLVAPNNRLTIWDQKLKILTSGIREQNKGTTRPQRQQMEMHLVNRKI